MDSPSSSSWLGRAIRYRPGRLARGTLSISSGMFVQGLLQAAILIVLTRALGVTDYGGFLAAVAFMSLFTPLAGMGGAFLLVRDSARDSTLFPEAFGRGLSMIVIAAVPLVILVVTAARVILPSQISALTSLVLAISELLFVPACEMAARAYQGFERSGRLTVFRMSLFAVRLAVLSALWGTLQLSVTSAALAYAGSAALVAAVTLAITARELGSPRFHSHGLFAGLSDGFYFSVNYTAYRINSDVDKVMLSRLVSLETAGFVGAGFRLMQGVLLPVRALLEAGYARFYHAGAQGPAATLSLGRRWLPIPLAYSVLTGIGIFVFAGITPLLLGPDFGGSVQVLRWFSVYPMLFLLHYGLDTMLTTSNRQRYVAWVMLGGAVVNIGLNFWLIPLLQWKGAVVSAYCSEILIIGFYGSALWRGGGPRQP